MYVKDVADSIIGDFSAAIRQRGQDLFRPMPWREDIRPYYVLVSELMLQQTQVARVIPKFNDFIERFPNEAALASASLSDVLTLWQGLGYNRRAKYLHESAKMIMNDFEGIFPSNEQDILKLPGVGKNTAGAIQAYAFNRPVLFVETNVRTVYIHHFFKDDFDIDDKAILQIMQETVPWAKGKEQPDRFSHKSDGAMRKTVGLSYFRPREFYWALMDYGSLLKASGVRNIDQSRHYKKQSALEGSVRQVRGRIIRELTSGGLSEERLRANIFADHRYESALNGLIKDGLVRRTGETLHLTK